MNPYEYAVFRVGDCIPALAINGEGCMVDFIGGTLHIYTLVCQPPSMLRFNADVDKHGMRLGVFMYQNAMMLAVKLGNLPWQDAPYTPHLTSPENLPKNTPLLNGEGLVAYHLLIDSSEGRILQIKPFVLNSHFSNFLINGIYTLKQDPFSYNEYLSTVNYIQQRYSPRDLGTRVNKDYFYLPPRNT